MFKNKTLYFTRSDPTGYNYKERVEKNTKNYDKKELMGHMRNFFKKNKKYSVKKGRKKKNKTKIYF